jgi:hypothetical protein
VGGCESYAGVLSSLGSLSSLRLFSGQPATFFYILLYLCNEVSIKAVRMGGKMVFYRVKMKRFTKITNVFLF